MVRIAEVITFCMGVGNYIRFRKSGALNILPESGRGHSDIETVICETIRSVGVKLSSLYHTVPAVCIQNVNSLFA